MAWPTIEIPSRINGRYLKKQHKTNYDTGRPVSTAADVIGHYEWQLTWTDMSDANLEKLIAAVEADMGSEFDWTHPYNGRTYKVIYQEDGLDYDMVEDYATNHNQVTVKLLQSHYEVIEAFTTTTTIEPITTTTSV
jgi:hypothetical protein